MTIPIEEIVRRYTTQRAGGPPVNPTPITRARPARTPVVINGMEKLLHYLADLDKRLTALEEQVKQHK
jgi:hypothetical protein